MFHKNQTGMSHNITRCKLCKSQIYLILNRLQFDPAAASVPPGDNRDAERKPQWRWESEPKIDY